MRLLSVIMHSRIFPLLPLFIVLSGSVPAQQTGPSSTSGQIVIEWNSGKPSGIIEVRNGKLSTIRIEKGKGKISGSSFQLTSSPARIMIELAETHADPGPGATIVSCRTKSNAFSFFLRDVSKDYPLLLPGYAVTVLRSDDHRSYNDIYGEIKSRNLKSKLAAIEDQPERSFETIDSNTRRQYVPTWLGTGRDMRMFQINEKLHGVADATADGMPAATQVITPKRAASSVDFTPAGYSNLRYIIMFGRGESAVLDVTRRLEDGALPILHSTLRDEDVEYHTTAFAAPEELAFGTPGSGTNFLVADKHLVGNTFTKEQQARADILLKKECSKAASTVLCYRLEISNKGKVPRYAWFRSPEASGTSARFNPLTGVSTLSDGSAFCKTTLNGQPLPNQENAILLAPEEKAVIVFFIPHLPVDKARMDRITAISFDKRYDACKKFWRDKLNTGAQIKLPEKRIEEMIRAGLLHLDMVTYGEEPDGALAASIGAYSPIATESAPIIQFYNSMGWNGIARRSLEYFLEKQHDDGLIQNFTGYMVETGAALWCIGEYMRYTKDTAWLRSIKDKLLKSANYLISWRNKNKVDSFAGKGYGMIDGKVADPEDHFHQFMLNAYAYLGLVRLAEMLSSIDMTASQYMQHEAQGWRKDIRAAFMESMATSPVVPLGDGSWSPTVAPWAEAPGPRALYIIPDNYYSHGTFIVPDAMLGPLYLVFCEVLDVNDPAVTTMMNYHSELFYQRNTVFSQPYYSRHNWLQLKKGMIKPFLQTYYQTFAGISDRETYDFWEHFFHMSAHKTHEEAWFLMETRWMLYMEDKDTLNLLKGIPRNWLQDGKEISLERVWSYFGPITLKVKSMTGTGSIEAVIEADAARAPRVVTIRLPHPMGKKAIKAEGGIYDPKTETIRIEQFSGKKIIRLEF